MEMARIIVLRNGYSGFSVASRGSFGLLVNARSASGRISTTCIRCGMELGHFVDGCGGRCLRLSFTRNLSKCSQTRMDQFVFRSDRVFQFRLAGRSRRFGAGLFQRSISTRALPDLAVVDYRVRHPVSSTGNGTCESVFGADSPFFGRGGSQFGIGRVADALDRDDAAITTGIAFWRGFSLSHDDEGTARHLDTKPIRFPHVGDVGLVRRLGGVFRAGGSAGFTLGAGFKRISRPDAEK